MEQKILAVLARLRPALNLHDGGLDYLGFRKKDKAVLIRFTGTCENCAISHITIQNLVQRELQRAVPSIKKVVPVLE